MKILAIDFGMKRMGFAVGSPAIRTATPIAPLHRNKRSPEEDFRHIQTLIDEYDISRIIVGYPLNMDGSKSPITLRVEAFVQRLRKKTDREIECVDERLTSFEAEEELKTIQPDYKKRKKVLDSMSAFVLLRGYMEAG